MFALGLRVAVTAQFYHQIGKVLISLFKLFAEGRNTSVDRDLKQRHEGSHLAVFAFNHQVNLVEHHDDGVVRGSVVASRDKMADESPDVPHPLV